MADTKRNWTEETRITLTCDCGSHDTFAAFDTGSINSRDSAIDKARNADWCVWVIKCPVCHKAARDAAIKSA